MSQAVETVQASDEDYVMPGEAARYLHVSPKTINRWANNGQIRCIVTLGGHRRFRRDDIDAAFRKMTELGTSLSEWKSPGTSEHRER